MERNLGSVWIGLSKEPYSALKFTDLSPAHYSYWGAGQPNRPLDQRTCIQANVSGYHVGRWDDVDCNTKNPFICEVYHGMLFLCIYTRKQFFRISKISTEALLIIQLIYKISFQISSHI